MLHPLAIEEMLLLSSKHKMRYEYLKVRRNLSRGPARKLYGELKTQQESSSIVFFPYCSDKCCSLVECEHIKEYLSGKNDGAVVFGSRAHATTTLATAIAFAPSIVHRSNDIVDGHRISVQISFNVGKRGDWRSSEAYQDAQKSPVEVPINIERDGHTHRELLTAVEDSASRFMMKSVQNRLKQGSFAADGIALWADVGEGGAKCDTRTKEERQTDLRKAIERDDGDFHKFLVSLGATCIAEFRVLYGDCCSSSFSRHSDSGHANGVAEDGIVMHFNVAYSFDYRPGDSSPPLVSCVTKKDGTSVLGHVLDLHSPPVDKYVKYVLGEPPCLPCCCCCRRCA